MGKADQTSEAPYDPETAGPELQTRPQKGSARQFHRSWEIWIPAPALPESCCVTLSKFLPLSGPVLVSEKLACGIRWSLGGSARGAARFMGSGFDQAHPLRRTSCVISESSRPVNWVVLIISVEQMNKLRLRR